MASNIPAIAVIQGGNGAEAEVSRSTGQAVYNALKQTYDNVKQFELGAQLAETLKAFAPTVVFPAVHGAPGEDGTLQGFLDLLGIPYVGSGVAASAVAFNKALARAVLVERGLPMASAVICHDHSNFESSAERALRTLGESVVVKPSCQGSSIGVSFANGGAELRRALEQAFAYSDSVVVEQRIIGREITCGVLATPDARALPVIEVRTPPGSWYNYEHRYTAGLSEHVIPAGIRPEQAAEVQRIALAAHLALGCRDLSRSDFVVPEHGTPVLLEVNTLPGMTSTSLYPDAARAAGLDFPKLVSQLIEAAIARNA